jgi:hypothetical protein
VTLGLCSCSSSNTDLKDLKACIHPYAWDVEGRTFSAQLVTSTRVIASTGTVSCDRVEQMRLVLTRDNDDVHVVFYNETNRSSSRIRIPSEYAQAAELVELANPKTDLKSHEWAFKFGKHTVSSSTDLKPDEAALVFVSE